MAVTLIYVSVTHCKQRVKSIASSRDTYFFHCKSIFLELWPRPIETVKQFSKSDNLWSWVLLRKLNFHITYDRNEFCSLVMCESPREECDSHSFTTVTRRYTTVRFTEPNIFGLKILKKKNFRFHDNQDVSFVTIAIRDDWETRKNHAQTKTSGKKKWSRCHRIFISPITLPLPPGINILGYLYLQVKYGGGVIISENIITPLSPPHRDEYSTWGGIIS